MLGPIHNEEKIEESGQTMPNSYWQNYNLQQAPFDESSHFAMFYPLPNYQQLLQFLNSLTEQAQLLATITGVMGIGKSMLLAQYNSQIDSRLQVINIRSHLAVRASTLLQTLCHSAGISIENQMPAAQQIKLLLNSLNQQKYKGVLLVDDAHRLPLESLSWLMQLALAQHQQEEANVYIVLLGEPQLNSRVKNLQAILGFHESVPHMEIKPLSLEETKGYLRHRLTKAGLTTNFPFDDLTIKRIHQLAGGVPGKINKIAKQLMQEKAPISQTGRGNESIERAEHNVKKPKKYLVKYLCGLIGLVGLGLIIGGYNYYTPLHKNNKNDINLKQPLISKPISPPSAPLTQPSMTTSALPTTDNAVVQSTAKQPDTIINKPTPVTVAERPTLKVSQDQIQAKVDIKPKMLTSSPVIKASSPPEKKLIPLMLSPKIKGYTLQLLASTNLATLQGYIESQSLIQARYFKTRKQGLLWYVLVLGHYPTHAAAQAAIKRLPVDIRKQKPWARSLVAIRKEAVLK